MFPRIFELTLLEYITIPTNIIGPMCHLQECRSIRARNFTVTLLLRTTRICSQLPRRVSGVAISQANIQTNKQRILLGCNNRGGGGNFSKVKWLVRKWMGTRKRLFSRFLGWVKFAFSHTRLVKSCFPRINRVASRCCASFPLVGCVGEACTCYSCNFSSSRALVFHGR